MVVECLRRRRRGEAVGALLAACVAGPAEASSLTSDGGEARSVVVGGAPTE